MAKVSQSMVKEFKEFILRGNVVDLAVGVVIGAAFGAIVTSLVKDVITPLIGAIGRQPDFSGLRLTIHGSQIMYGNFVNALITFLIIAAVVFFLIVKPMNHLKDLRKPSDIEPDMQYCPECLSEIPAKAKRCMYCTLPIVRAKKK